MQRVTVTVLACGAHGTEVAAARQVFNIGFTTHHGSVACAEEWGAPVRRRYVRPSMPGSYEVRTPRLLRLPVCSRIAAGLDRLLVLPRF